MINSQAFLFLEKMNGLAERTAEGKPGIVPFYGTVKEKKMDVGFYKNAIFYDNQNPVEVHSWDSLGFGPDKIKLVCYPVVKDMLVDDQHDKILEYEDNVYVCIPDRKVKPFVIIYDYDESYANAPDGADEEKYKKWFSIKNGKWANAF